MVDFILRHGNDLLAVECLRGYEVCVCVGRGGAGPSSYFVDTCALAIYVGHCWRVLSTKWPITMVSGPSLW